MKSEEASTMTTRRALRYYYLKAKHFLRYDMWRLSTKDTPKRWRFFSDCIKAVHFSTQRFITDDLASKAASLTYSTVLSIVPILAVIVAIAKGFGLQHIVHSTLLTSFPGQQEELSIAFGYVDNYLAQVQGGLFLGVGLIILLYTVLMLFASMEDAFNSIWQAPHPRPWGRRILSYFGLFLLVPILLVVSGGLTLLMASLKSSLVESNLLIEPMYDGLLRLLPFIVSSGLLVFAYMFMPNVRVRFWPALISGVLAGIAFQFFQALYISGVLWISRYNAVYGSFASVPLLLLWLQLSWSIALYGAQLSYCIQHLDSFAFEKSIQRISRRYQDFITILIASRVVQRFALSGSEGEPYQAETLANECQIPIRLTVSTLQRLVEAGILTEVLYSSSSSDGIHYQPALDPSLLSIRYLFNKLDQYGEEDFRVDHIGRYAYQWQAMLALRDLDSPFTPETLLKDLY